MNVLITNQQETLLSGLSVEIIKTLRGEYDAEEIIGTFSNFFFGRMILDLTSIKNYQNITNIQKLSIGLPVEKIILLLPANGEYSTNQYLSKLISMGFYNFTTNLEGVEYLINNPNTYKDVAHLHQIEPVVAVAPMAMPGMQPQPIVTEASGEVAQQMVPEPPKVRVIGIKNATDGAGATTLVVTMKRELEKFHGLSVKAIEVGKRDFVYFNDKSLVSIGKPEFLSEISKSANYDLVLVDLNDMDENACSEVYYLIEPSIIKINKIVKRDKNVFEKLKNERIIINKSMISNDEITEFATESGLRIFTALRPFNDRSRTQVLTNLLNRMGIIHVDTGDNSGKSGGFGGIFRH